MRDDALQPGPIWHPSPNFGERRHGVRPNLIVLHYTAMDSATAALDRLCDPATEVSAHYLIAEDGRLWQMVDETMRAWHAGAGQWGGRGDVNSRSVGIELANTGAHPFPEPQMGVLGALLPRIMQRWGIPPKGVIAHSDMAPARKSDPGPRFDWQRLAREGASIWYDEAGGNPGGAAFRESALLFGYPDDAGDAELLSAFRQRFRPWKTGKADTQDLRIIRQLARRFPVDRDAANA